MVSITGRLTLEDGSAPQGGLVILQCGSTERARASADPNGNFMILVKVSQANPRNQPPGSNPIEGWVDCDLHADVADYRSEGIHLGGHLEQVVDAGTMVLHPLSPERGFAVSVTSLAAPDKAKKDFAKGQEQERKGKWAAACDYFKRAIQEYPHYALAWLELGRAQVRQNSFAEAQHSFRQAVAQALWTVT